MKRFLVIGYSSRNIASSAHRAGYEVYAIDAFCDQDLQELSQDCYELDDEDVHEIKPEKLVRIARDFNVDFDFIVLGSGFELIERNLFDTPILNNSIESMEKVSDKKQFAEELQKIDMPHPKTWNASSHPEINKTMILKPKNGGGGVFNRVVTSEDDFDTAIEDLANCNPNLSKENMILQEFVTGFPASVSVISTGKESVAVAVNEQLIGIPWLTRMPFAYCGNITPFETQYKDEMMEIAEKLCTHFGLVGSNGVDFLITENGPIVLEINARFQGSLDSVEGATGLNLFESHLRSFEGLLPKRPSPDNFAARTIVYVDDQDLCVGEELKKLAASINIADIPKPNHVAIQDEPFLSILEKGKSRQEIMERLNQACLSVRKYAQVK